MDRMSLLCTLHGDGPRTLRMLRDAGCRSLGSLVELSAEEVSSVLGITEADARRLSREARRLVERLEPELEPEEVTYPAAPAPPTSTSTAPQPAASRDETPIPLPGGQATDARGRLDVRDQALLARVVDRYRERASGPEPESSLSASEELAQLRQVEVRAGKVVEAEPVGLEVGSLPGLDAEVRAALVRAGVRCLEDLASRAIDELGESSGLGFTRLRTLQFRASRRLQEAPRAEEPSTPELERLSPSERPLPEPTLPPGPAESAPRGSETNSDSWAAGPFA